MMRALTRSALLLALAGAACGGESEPPDAALPDAALPDAAACIPAVTPAYGWHYPGVACNGCHGFGASGTVYAAASGGAAVTGATVRLVDGAGATTDITVHDNGNFWLPGSFNGPAEVIVSRCPDLARMPTTVSPPVDCNTCHSSGKRIHLP